MAETEKVGRLALRREGGFWNAYWAEPSSMEGAVLLGSICMAFVEDPDIKQRFMDLMRDGLSIGIKQTIGEVTEWRVETAPEHERSGHG